MRRPDLGKIATLPDWLKDLLGMSQGERSAITGPLLLRLKSVQGKRRKGKVSNPIQPSVADPQLLVLLLSAQPPPVGRASAAAPVRRQCELMEEILATTRLAVMTLSARNGILFCTDSARRCLRRYFPATTQCHETLPPPVRDWLRQAKRNRDGWSSMPPMILEQPEGRLTIHPLAAPSGDRRILWLEEQRTGQWMECLQRQLRLTPREAEVLFWVAQGKMNAGIAILLGLRTATVEKHLEHILAKLKVETRTAAACCANETVLRSQVSTARI